MKSTPAPTRKLSAYAELAREHQRIVTLRAAGLSRRASGRRLLLPCIRPERAPERPTRVDYAFSLSVDALDEAINQSAFEKQTFL